MVVCIQAPHGVRIVTTKLWLLLLLLLLLLLFLQGHLTKGDDA